MKLKYSIAALLLSITFCKGAGGLVTGPLSPVSGGGSGGSATNLSPWQADINAAGNSLTNLASLQLNGNVNSTIENTGGGSIAISNGVTHAVVTMKANGELVGNFTPVATTNLAATLYKATGGVSNWFASSDVQRALSLLSAVSNASSRDVVQIYAGNYQLTNSLHMPMGSSLIGAGEFATTITYYGSNATPSYCLDLKDNCLVQDFTITNWFATNYFQNILGYDYENSINQRFTNVVIKNFRGFSRTDWFIMKDLFTDDPTPPFVTSILFDNCELYSQWDHQTTGSAGGGLDWAPVWYLNYRNCIIGFHTQNQSRTNDFVGNDGGQRVWRGVDTILADGGAQTYTVGQLIVLDTTRVQVNNTTNVAMFGSTHSIITNYNSQFKFPLNGPFDLNTAQVFSNFCYGLFWTNGIQHTPVKQ